MLDGSKAYSNSKGELNQTLFALAKSEFERMGHSYRESQIDQGYDIQEEIEKILWADVLLYQMPVWWMGEPWIVKKYIDEVFYNSYGKLYSSDGRSADDESKKYGSGGLAKGKRYMLSLTWNAPLEAFVQKDQFFEGMGVDGVFFHFHKIHEFLGMHALETFMCNDVVKNPQISQYKQDYLLHLQKIFQ